MIKNIIFDIKGVLVDYHPTDWESLFAGESKEHPFTLLPGIELFQQLYDDLKDKGYSFYILSNFKQKRFELLKRFYPKIFNLFDGVMLSEQCGYAKPDERIFHCLFNKYGITPEESLFIDDGPHNITAAQQLGMAGIWCDNFENLKSGLRQKGLI